MPSPPRSVTAAVSRPASGQLPGPKQRPRGPLAAIALLLVAAGAWWVVRYFSDESQIRRSWKAVARAVAEEKALAVGSHLSRRYSDPYGQSYESVLGATVDLFSSYEELRFAHSLPDIAVSGNTAVVTLEFRLYGKSQGKSGIILGEAGTPCRAAIEMRKERGGWIVERVESIEIPNAPAAGGPAKEREP